MPEGTTSMLAEFTCTDDYDMLVTPNKTDFLSRLKPELEEELGVEGEDRIQNLDARSG